jgi:hypothetical protein
MKVRNWPTAAFRAPGVILGSREVRFYLVHEPLVDRPPPP